MTNKKSKLKNDKLGRLWDGCRFSGMYERIERVESDDESHDVGMIRACGFTTLIV